MRQEKLLRFIGLWEHQVQAPKRGDWLKCKVVINCRKVRELLTT